MGDSVPRRVRHGAVRGRLSRMTQETMEWLNVNTLIGFTRSRGNAWTFRQSLQNGRPNHYLDAVPVEDVRSRLFDWTALESPVFTVFQGNEVQVPDRKAIIRSDTGDVLGLFKSGYRPHQYDQWLLRNVANILDAGL